MEKTNNWIFYLHALIETCAGAPAAIILFYLGEIATSVNLVSYTHIKFKAYLQKQI